MTASTPITTPFTAESTAAEVVDGIDLTGRRAIVTGGASGIGIETARALAGAGAEVTLAVRNVEAGERTADDITGTTGSKQVLVARLLLNGEVMPVHHLHAHIARRHHHAAEIRVQLRGAAGDVERRDAPPLQEFDHQIGSRGVHLLGAVRAGIDVAVHAGLVATIADIDLQGLKLPARDRREGDLGE